MTTTKTTHPKTAPDTEPDTPAAEPAPAAAPAKAELPFIGDPLRDGETASTVTLSAHLRMSGRDCLPGDKVRVSYETQRRLARNGYLARS
jgi:hypothetical protein